MIGKEKINVCVMVVGNWNAVVGEGKLDKTVGENGLEKRNERGQRLVDFCKENDLIVGNTLSKTHRRR